MNDLNPFTPAAKSAAPGGALAEATSTRVVAEVQAMLVIAKKFPRDPRVAMDKILNSFTRPGLAEVAKYQYSKGGTEVDGPSIRSAEAIAQMWGNIEFGFREVNRGVGPDGVGFSEVEAFAWDLESMTRRPASFRVRHWRDTKKGGYALNDERDIYELYSNQAQRRVRACILAIIPGDVVDAAMQQAEVTLKTKVDVSPTAQAAMLEAFGKFQVTKEQIEKRIQRRLDTIQPAQMVNLKKVYASLRDGMSTPAEWFDQAESGGADEAFTVAPKAAPPATKPPAPAQEQPPAASQQDAPPEPMQASMIDDEPDTGELASDSERSYLATRAKAARADLDAIMTEMGISPATLTKRQFQRVKTRLISGR